MKVFISSTVFDLIDVRAELENLIRDMGLSPVLSDSSTSDFVVNTDANSIETCLVNVRASDIMLVVLSNRYGPSLENAGFPNLSATHLEYKEARNIGIPIYVYVRDRLESDYHFWKKDKARKDFSWVKKETDYPLFDFIHEHQALSKTQEKSNWYSTFSNSVELKKLVRRDLALPAGRVSLERAIRENKMPIIEGVLDVNANTPSTGKILCTCTFKNVGSVPAYKVTMITDDNKEEIWPILAPASSQFRQIIFNIPSFLSNISIKYYTADGHVVTDSFILEVKNKGKMLLYGIVLKDKVYEVGTTTPFSIISSK